MYFSQLFTRKRNPQCRVVSYHTNPDIATLAPEHTLSCFEPHLGPNGWEKLCLYGLDRVWTHLKTANLGLPVFLAGSINACEAIISRVWVGTCNVLRTLLLPVPLFMPGALIGLEAI